jgi:aminoglycoside phosphotransferase (APT) family kinase protein
VTAPSEALRDGVSAAIAELGHDSGEVELSEIPGGASRQTWLVESGRERFVLRRDPPQSESLASQQQEFRLIGLAAESGVPVAEPLLLEPPGGRFETAGILMAHVDGISVAPRVLRREELAGARERLPAQLGGALARIHALDPGRTGLSDAGADPALAQVERWEAELDRIGEPLPALELGLRWLRAHRPAPAAPALVHGDFRLGNFIVDQRGLAAVIDWELAHLGDPAEDVGWLCIRSWRFGNDNRQVAGLSDLDSFLAAYRKAGGAGLDRERIRYWETFGNLKWAVICARQAQDHLTGRRPSHELASLGRRVCEPEWDMLQLIEAAA